MVGQFASAFGAELEDGVIDAVTTGRVHQANLNQDRAQKRMEME